MSIFEAIILGIVQGLGEFLPISSSGHLVLTQNILGIKEADMFFTVLLHMGTLIPVLIVYFSDIVELIKKPFQKYVYLLIVATIPAVVVSLLFEDYIEMLFAGTVFLGVGFLFTGCVLMYADKPRENTKLDDDITYKDAAKIGSMQALAVLPAVSRSGSTIAGALICGIERETAAKFSFLMSIPAILGAFIFELIKLISNGEPVASELYAPYAFGFIAAMLSGYLAIRFMLKVIASAKLRYFAYYVFALGVFVIIDSLFLHIIM